MDLATSPGRGVFDLASQVIEESSGFGVALEERDNEIAVRTSLLPTLGARGRRVHPDSRELYSCVAFSGLLGCLGYMVGEALCELCKVRTDARNVYVQELPQEHRVRLGRVLS